MILIDFGPPTDIPAPDPSWVTIFEDYLELAHLPDGSDPWPMTGVGSAVSSSGSSTISVSDTTMDGNPALRFTHLDTGPVGGIGWDFDLALPNIGDGYPDQAEMRVTQGLRLQSNFTSGGTPKRCKFGGMISVAGFPSGGAVPQCADGWSQRHQWRTLSGDNFQVDTYLYHPVSVSGDEQVWSASWKRGDIVYTRDHIKVNSSETESDGFFHTAISVNGAPYATVMEKNNIQMYCNSSANRAGGLIRRYHHVLRWNDSPDGQADLDIGLVKIEIRP